MNFKELINNSPNINNDNVLSLKEKLKAKAQELNIQLNYEKKSKINKKGKKFSYKNKKQRQLERLKYIQEKKALKEAKKETHLKRMKELSKDGHLVFESIKEIDNGKKIYKTFLLNKICKYEINKKESSKLYIRFSTLDKKGFKYLNLFTPQTDDEFLGIYYSYKKLDTPVFYTIEDKTFEVKYCYYLKIKFKKGTIKIKLNILKYIFNIYNLLKKYIVYAEELVNFEKEIYKFYGKKNEKSPLIKFLENQINREKEKEILKERQSELKEILKERQSEFKEKQSEFNFLYNQIEKILTN